MAVVTADTLLEFVVGQFVQERGEHRAAFVHNGFSPRVSGRRPGEAGPAK